jgi:hypothetical protein
MKLTGFAGVVLFLALPLAGGAQSTAQTASITSPMSPSEARSLIKSAHTTAEYKQLAGYFHQQEADYRAKATAEKTERDRRAQINAGLYQKYPRPVDEAQNLYESYLSRANTAALQARHYDQLAAGTDHQDQRLATAPEGKA